VAVKYRASNGAIRCKMFLRPILLMGLTLALGPYEIVSPVAASGIRTNLRALQDVKDSCFRDHT
jgi:hypothetical protein